MVIVNLTETFKSVLSELKNRFSGLCKVCSVMQHAELIFFAAELTYHRKGVFGFFQRKTSHTVKTMDPSLKCQKSFFISFSFFPWCEKQLRSWSKEWG
jgi:hypothetical protein